MSVNNNSNLNYRCRKCRMVLFTRDSLLTCHGEPLEEISPSNLQHEKCFKGSSNVIFMDEQKVSSWIRDQIDDGEWTRGRLTCPGARCGARVGSFNFINGESCSCGQHQLPSVQFIRSKVDQPFT